MLNDSFFFQPLEKEDQWICRRKLPLQYSHYDTTSVCIHSVEKRKILLYFWKKAKIKVRIHCKTPLHLCSVSCSMWNWYYKWKIAKKYIGHQTKCCLSSFCLSLSQSARRKEELACLGMGLAVWIYGIQHRSINSFCAFNFHIWRAHSKNTTTWHDGILKTHTAGKVLET